MNNFNDRVDACKDGEESDEEISLMKEPMKLPKMNLLNIDDGDSQIDHQQPKKIACESHKH